MRLILVRHAESEHTLRGIIAGTVACTGLSARGKEQANALSTRLGRSEELADCGFVLASPVLRTRQTAEIMASALPVQQIQQDCDLCELHPMLFGIPRPGTGAWLDPSNTGITEWRVSDDRWHLVRYNDSAPCGCDGD